MVQCQAYVAADGHMIQPRGSRSTIWFKVKVFPSHPILFTIVRVDSEDGEYSVCRNFETGSKYDGTEL